MKGILFNWRRFTAAALLLGTSSCCFANTLPSCKALNQKISEHFPNVLAEQPALESLTKALGNYTKKELVGSRYEWEKDDFMLVIQQTNKDASVSIIPEKMETPDGEVIHIPVAFENILRTPPAEALATAQHRLGKQKMNQTHLYQYSWNCSSWTKGTNKKATVSSIRAQFNDQGDFVALLY